MTLKSYLATLPRGGKADFATSLGVSPSFLSQLVSGLAPISPARCILIEKLTVGAVKRHEMRPLDYALIWPELTCA